MATLLWVICWAALRDVPRGLLGQGRGVGCERHEGKEGGRFGHTTDADMVRRATEIGGSQKVRFFIHLIVDSKDPGRRLPEDALFQSLNQVQSAGGADDGGYLADRQCKRSILKFLLHIAATKVAQVPTLTSTAAIRLGQRQLPKGDFSRLDSLLVGLENALGLFSGAGDLGLLPA